MIGASAFESLRERVRWGFRVQGRLIQIGFVRKSQFRWEFLNQVVMDLLFYISFILTFDILYGLGGSGEEGAVGALTLGGWTHTEMRIYLGMVFLADSVTMTFLGQHWHFGEDLKNGKLDSFRVRPGGVAYLYFFQRFSPEGLTNMALGAGWLVYALSAVVPGEVGLGQLAWALPCALVVIAWSQVFLMLSYNLCELWLLNSDLGHLMSMFMSNFGERPLDVYPKGIARFLMFVVPVAGIAWYPASLLLGRLDLAFALLYPLVLIAFAFVVMRLFRRGMRRYESALG